MGSTVAAAAAVLRDLVGEDLTDQPDAALLDRLRELQQLRCVVDAAMVAATGAAHRQGAAGYDGAISTKAWLRGRLRLGSREASVLVEAGRGLPELPRFAALFAAGRTSLAHVTHAVWLARRVGPELADRAEAALVEHAERLSPVDLQQVAKRIAEHLKPAAEKDTPPEDRKRNVYLSKTFDGLWALRGDLTPEAGALLQTAVNAATPRPTPGDDRTAAERRHDALADIARLALDAAQLPVVAGEQPHLSVLVRERDLRTHHIRPDPATDQAPVDADPTETDPAGANTDPDAVDLTADPADPADLNAADLNTTEAEAETATATATADQPLTVADILAATQPDQPEEPGEPGEPAASRDHHPAPASPATIRHTPPSTSSGNKRLLLADRASPETDQLDDFDPCAPPGGTTDWGDILPSATLRRLACDAAINRVVLGPGDVPLSAGRRLRLPTPAMRRVLVARDRGCRFPLCDRPPAWTQAHHIRSWIDGGPTDLGNLILLCGHHHRRVHEDGWQLHLHGTTVTATRPDGTTLHPPPD
jgi:hypothetical protein